MPAPAPIFVAIACGGTGGHLLPGRAVARALAKAGAVPHLFISNKPVDQRLVRDLPADQVTTLPAMAAGGWRWDKFALRLGQSLRQARRAFRRCRPAAVLAMGGFASAAPVLAGRLSGARVFLHEANSVAGRANRWLGWLAETAFVHFPSAADRLRTRRTRVVGMPVRAGFHPRDAAGCRQQLELDPARPTLLILGGSQGARDLNSALLAALPALLRAGPALQFIHLTGAADLHRVRGAYVALNATARVEAFLDDTHLAMGAADLAVSRAGASSLAELAATRLPAILVPYPYAADNHQHHNARHFAEGGAVKELPQGDATPQRLGREISSLLGNPTARVAMRNALARLHQPDAATVVARHILAAVTAAPFPLPLLTTPVAQSRTHP